MIKLSILIALFVFANVSLAGPEVEAFLNCMQKEGANEEAVKAEMIKFLKGEAATVSKPTKCVVACVFETLKLVTPQRKFNMEMLQTIGSKIIHDVVPPAELNNLLKSCESKATSTDRCEFVWSFVSCVVKGFTTHLGNLG